MEQVTAASLESVLILAVHPDDESLGAGGLIQRTLDCGGQVRVVVVTDGENNPWPQRFVERRWRLDDSARARWGTRRRVEAMAALNSLGVSSDKISFWHYPDGGLTAMLRSDGEAIVARLVAEFEKVKPTHVVGPSPSDLHPDHSSLAVMVSLALARFRSASGRPFELLEYLVHTNGVDPAGRQMELALAPEQVALKREAILRHATQMALSRSRFTAFAQSTETFTVRIHSPSWDYSHPVAGAEFTGVFLRLKIRRSIPLAPLFLVSISSGKISPHTVTFVGGKTARLSCAVTGKLIATGQLSRRYDYHELSLPAAVFASVETLYVKMAAPQRFFDRAGWRELSLASAPTEPNGFSSVKKKDAPVCCVIPCYNVGSVCGPIVQAATRFADLVVAVDDGSTDDTGNILGELEARFGGRLHLLSFPHNRGKGAALLEAFHWLSRNTVFEAVVTLDGDGQHRPEDIPRLARSVIEEQNDMVVGERLARVKMPLRSRLGNTLTAGIMKLLQPGAPTDTQSGFRAFRPEFVRAIVESIDAGRYETELKILLLALQQHRRIGSLTIPTVYLDGNRLSHFRAIIDSWRIYRTLFLWRLAAVDISQTLPAHLEQGETDDLHRSAGSLDRKFKSATGA